MTSLIVGLGNPGLEYAETRHNLGFDVVNLVAESLSVSWRRSSSLYDLATCERGGRTVYLARPLTYMNLSGEAVAALRERLALALPELLIIVDDINLPPGALRIRARGSDGGHNGLASIIEALGSQSFPRMRLGVGEPPEGIDPADYVLDRFAPDESEKVREMVAKATKAAIFALDHRLTLTISKHNYNPAPPTELE